MYRVLLVDDDPHLQAANRAYLEREGYEILCAFNGEEALRLASTARLNAIVLDVDIPGPDGVTVCRLLREVSSVPILFLSAYAETDDRIRGLLAGGDDFIAKPYSLMELELRLRLHIRRAENQAGSKDMLRFGTLTIDPALREVRNEGKAIPFTALEFDLLAFLAQHPGQVFSYEQLYDRVWREPMNCGLHNIQVCMARVRQKLDRLCPGQCFIETVRRKGYLFRAERTAATAAPTPAQTATPASASAPCPAGESCSGLSGAETAGPEDA